MIDLLQPELTVEPRPTDPEAARYVRSYLIMRIFIGALGVVLPFMLVLSDGLAFDGDPFPHGSLSAYYYSGARELFVGALSAIGVFLFTYKVASSTLENTLSILAGFAVAAVAIFPTGPPPEGTDLTSLQDLLGESVVTTIHYVSAAVFIASLAVISFFFGVREGSRAPREGRRSPTFWRWYHWSWAATIVVALLWIAVTQIIGSPDKALLIGEAVAVWAFGASWLMKGFELDTLRGK
jgi:hypothetical protein